MKRWIVLVCVMALVCAMFCGCNMTVVDTTYSFDEAIIFRADGEQKVSVKNWKDFENSDMIQITLEDGSVYLTHSSNVILISSK